MDLEMLKLCYEYVIQLYNNTILIKGLNDKCFKLINSNGDILEETNFSDIIPFDDLLYCRKNSMSLKSQGYQAYSRHTFKQEIIPYLLNGMNVVGFDTIEVLPNGMGIGKPFIDYTIDYTKVILNKAGYPIGRANYSAIRLVGATSLGLKMWYTLGFPDYNVSGTLILGNDGFYIDKLYEKAYDMFSIWYVPVIKHNRLTHKCTPAICGRRITQDVFDDVVYDPDDYRGGYIKVISNKTVGILDTSGNVVIPVGTYSSIWIVSKGIFVGNNINTKYTDIIMNGNIIKTKLKVADVNTSNILPVIELRIDNTDKTFVNSRKKNEENLVSIYFGNDGLWHSNMIDALTIYQNIKVLNTENKRIFRVCLYGQYWDMYEDFSLISDNDKKLLENTVASDWMLVKNK